MQVRWKGAVLSAVVAGGLVGLSLLPQQANAAPQQHAVRRPDEDAEAADVGLRLRGGRPGPWSPGDEGRRDSAAARYSGKAGGSSGNFYFPSGSRGCSYTLGSNVNMDTDCQNVSDPDLAGRGQAQNETYISEDHFRPGNLRRQHNDYRRGDGGCFGYYSLDNGRTFQDVPIPNSFTRGAAYGAAPRSTGAAAATPPAPSTPAATPTTAARSSTAACPPAATPTCRAPSSCSARPATAAPPTPSPPASSTEQPDVSGHGHRAVPRQAAPDGRQPRRAARSVTAST